MLTLESRRLRIRFDEDTGSVRELFDKAKRIDYAAAMQADAFRIETAGGTTSRFERCRHSISESPNGETTIAFEWEAAKALTVVGTVAASAERDEIRFFSEVRNDSGETVVGLEYPIVPNLQAITNEGADDYVAHSFATGLCVRNPIKHFGGDVGLRHMPYPESYSGASMQFFAYYGERRGGLYFAAYDGEMHPKWLNFYKNGNGLLEASFFHGAESMAPGTGMTVGYPVVVAPLDGEGWYEAADRYKRWALQQFWCRRGPLSERPEAERARWLNEGTGACTFGINAGRDRSAWIHEYHKYIETPMFHVLGPDWVHRTQNFYNGVPGGMDDWFPTRFHPANLEAMKAYGDKYAPFEFDYLFGLNGADADRGRQALQRFPEERALRSIDKYKFSLVCPADPFIQALHVRRDERLQAEADVDSIYYDISANNILKVCMDESHGHPVGAGRQIAAAYLSNYAATKAAMIEKAGRYIPMGTEMMNEAFLGVLDYYQARAGGRPAAPLEMYNFKSLLATGEAALIPMFTYVYNEYGALRMDGWGKLTEEIGSLFYFAAARTYLWGGIYELNYEYSPMEAIDGKENDPEEHYYIFEPRGYALSPERARYLGALARMRVGPGNKYLAYGKMLRPLSFERETAALDWFHYNCDKNFPEYNESGVYEADAVVHSAWQYREESAAFFFANVTEEARNVSFELDMKRYRLPGASYRVRRFDGDAIEDGGEIAADGAKAMRLTIPPKRVVILEVIVKGPGDGAR
ncbi:DUF6259 domain-containing protein [Paenibacillus sp.]|uniref:DUF6259 domain-containing protein n=1 Tax=Paenibacillus sp. TaxID=58172 RepID=UPI0028112AA3|nr:DUF6259 domain-containing protein [Paenibacillus sp.]